MPRPQGYYSNSRITLLIIIILLSFAILLFAGVRAFRGPPWVGQGVGRSRLSVRRIRTTVDDDKVARRRRSTTVFSSFDKEREEPELLARWERMYEEGSAAARGIVEVKRDTETRKPVCSQVRVITFDLDDTLWKTGATIAAANDALATHVHEKLLASDNGTTATATVRVEKVMGTLYSQNKAKYSPMQGNEAKAPVLLTQLRKDAIRYVLTEYGGMDDSANDTDGLEALVDEAFAVWVSARYQSIPNHFAESVISCLQDIRSLQTSDNTRVVVGAITDGNSNPTNIPELMEYFDFCINAESVGISKPDKSVYLRGVARALQHPSLRDMVPAVEKMNRSSGPERRLTDAALENLVGPWWVHVGDDFVKDCVAAKSLNMRTIWVRELVRDKIVKEEAWRTAARSSKQGRTVEQLVKEVAELQVIEMQVGADNYLANSLEAEFADAVTDQFRDIAIIIRQWQDEAAAFAGDSSAAISNVSQESELPDNIQLIPPRTEEETMGRPEVMAPVTVSSSDTKFCIHCGTKLPVVAKFCFSCGEKQ